MVQTRAKMEQRIEAVERSQVAMKEKLLRLEAKMETLMERLTGRMDAMSERGRSRFHYRHQSRTVPLSSQKSISASSSKSSSRSVYPHSSSSQVFSSSSQSGIASSSLMSRNSRSRGEASRSQMRTTSTNSQMASQAAFHNALALSPAEFSSSQTVVQSKVTSSQFLAYSYTASQQAQVSPELKSELKLVSSTPSEQSNVDILPTPTIYPNSPPSAKQLTRDVLRSQMTANKSKIYMNQGPSLIRREAEVQLFNGEESYGRSSEPRLLSDGVLGDPSKKGGQSERLASEVPQVSIHDVHYVASKMIGTFQGSAISFALIPLAGKCKDDRRTPQAVPENVTKTGILIIDKKGNENVSMLFPNSKKYSNGKASDEESYELVVVSMRFKDSETFKGIFIGMAMLLEEDLVLLELPRKPTHVLQAEDRGYRQGQKDAVNLYIFCAKDALDQYDAVQEMKVEIIPYLGGNAEIEEKEMSVQMVSKSVDGEPCEVQFQIDTAVQCQINTSTPYPVDIGGYQMVEELMMVADMAVSEKRLNKYPTYSLLRCHPSSTKELLIVMKEGSLFQKLKWPRDDELKTLMLQAYLERVAAGDSEVTISRSMANDFLYLGFIPKRTVVQSFGEGSGQFQDIQAKNQLYDDMYEFNLSLSHDYVLVIRALGLLEGAANV